MAFNPETSEVCTRAGPGRSPLARRIARRLSRPVRLVVADDEPEVRSGIALFLRRAGCEVIEAADGAELIKRVAAEIVDPESNPRVDVAVIDVYMPHAGALIALSALHDIDAELPCIVISGLADPAVLDEARRLGAAACLKKPVDLEELMALVARLVPTVEAE